MQTIAPRKRVVASGPGRDQRNRQQPRRASAPRRSGRSAPARARWPAARPGKTACRRRRSRTAPHRRPPAGPRIGGLRWGLLAFRGINSIAIRLTFMVIVSARRSDLRHEISMADEAFALSPIHARASLPTDGDYDAIHEAFMETSRGRWFLTEYAKRNRNADTRMVLDAVERLEASLASQKQAQAEAVAAAVEAATAKPWQPMRQRRGEPRDRSLAGAGKGLHQGADRDRATAGAREQRRRRSRRSAPAWRRSRASHGRCASAASMRASATSSISR